MNRYEERLNFYIEMEKKGELIDFTTNDILLFKELCEVINNQLDVDVHFVSQLDMYYYSGAGRIIAEYIDRFSSEKLKSYLSRQIVADKVENCDKKILDLYNNFKTTDEYSSLDCDVNFITCLNYDWDFKELRPKRLKEELLKFAYNLRDATCLTGTIKMLSTWRLPEMEILLREYIHNEGYSYEDFHIDENDPLSTPSMIAMKRKLIELGVYCLRYYPNDENANIVKKYLYPDNYIIHDIAASSLKKMGMNLDTL